MTPVETFVERTTRASGVPLHVEDPAVLARLASLFVARPVHPEVKREKAIVSERRKAAPAVATPGAAKEARGACHELPV
jgi:hypothetical protein